jgi:adenylate cyclase
MATRRRLTLAQVFLFATLGTAVLVAVLLFGFLEASRRSILDAAEELRRAAALRVESGVQRELDHARRAVGDLERERRAGIVDVGDPKSVERALFAALVDEPALSDATFTHASGWQVSAYRVSADEGAAILRRTVEKKDGVDPTAHLTYASAVAAEGQALWSDLHWSELGTDATPRVVMTVQQAILDGERAIGVVRVGLLTEQIDRATRVHVGEEGDPHLVFVCDATGRLVTRAAPGDMYEVSGDDLRFPSARAPDAVRAALRDPRLARALTADVSSELMVGGTKLVASYHALTGTQDWIVGIVVPERFYTRGLEGVRNRYLVLFLVVIALVVVVGALSLRAVRRGLRQIEEATRRMRSFDLAPAVPRSAFRDVADVLDSLERAKTAMRTLGKYTPVDLVRALYRANEEPKLGGELTTLSIMFTDIEGFTSLSERLAPNDLAEALGAYLDTMTRAIRATGGTIDKFIGDAVMALWNAPAKLEGHAKHACRAALACREATRALYASSAWKGLPALVTRYGVHTDTVLVGHFGAPERMSYTALGDGVNLAARLEGLCKQYGVTILVSEAVADAVRDEFELRRVDRVAVKGKSRAVLVFELLGARGEARGVADAYEHALDDYFARRFDEALARLAELEASDGPSRTLAQRCRTLRAAELPKDWDGVYVAKSK